MKIIIVGCGKVGYTLVEQLGGENHDITVVDIKEENVRSITEELDAMGVIGNGTSYQTLSEAGIRQADLLIAVTNSDEQNLLCCVIAKKAGNCKTIARVRNPIYNSELEFLRKELGLAMIINPELASASSVARIFQFPSAIKIDTFAKGRVDLVEMKISQGKWKRNIWRCRRSAGISLKAIFWRKRARKRKRLKSGVRLRQKARQIFSSWSVSTDLIAMRAALSK